MLTVAVGGALGALARYGVDVAQLATRRAWLYAGCIALGSVATGLGAASLGWPWAPRCEPRYD